MNEEKGISFFDILHIIKKNLWWVLGVTLVITVVGTLLFYFVYNKSKETYSYGFEIHSDAIVEEKYPDGSIFRYEDLISYDSLKTIVESNDEFKSIDYKDMLENDKISISTYTEETTTNSKTDPVSYKVITVYAKYFDSKLQASDFMKAIVNAPVEKANQLTNNLKYDSNLDAFDTCISSYENKIAYLKAQRDFIIEQYNSLSEVFDSKFLVQSTTLGDNSGKTIAYYQNEIKNAYTDEGHARLLNIVETKYLTIDTNKNTLEARKNSLLKEKAENSVIIADLKTQYQELVGYYNPSTADVIAQQETTFQSRIATLVVRNAEIDNILNDIDEQLKKFNGGAYDMAAQAALEAELAEYRAELVEQTELFTKVKTIAIEQESKAIFKSNMPTADGGLNVWLELLISLLVGFILIVVIVCIKDLPKVLKEKNNPSIAAETPVLKEENTETKE